MKRSFPFFPAVLLLWLFSACNKAPEVFSVNNFAMTDAKGLATAGIQRMTVPPIEGTWYGMEHKIRVEKSMDETDLSAFMIGFIDTVQSPDTGSTWYRVDFLKAGGQPYAEVISLARNREEHDFSLVMSTYARVNKLTADTIIIQMMNSAFTEGWLKGKGYQYFVTSDQKDKEHHPVYISEDLPRLSALLKELYKFPRAFKDADTIVKKRQSF
jgi:hypothetical protein